MIPGLKKEKSGKTEKSLMYQTEKVVPENTLNLQLVTTLFLLHLETSQMVRWILKDM